MKTKTNEFKLVRITNQAARALESFTAKKNRTEMRVNASRWISTAILEKLGREAK